MCCAFSSMGNKISRKCLSVDERYTRPQGLYPQRNVDWKKLRHLILNSKLAPCFPGEEEANADFEECPICFLYYPSLNRSKCCSKGVCTECFLQMKSPRAARSTQCPFCKFHNYAVEYRGSKTLEEKGIEVAEEQKFIEAKIRMCKQELLDSEEREQHITPKTLKDEPLIGHSIEISKDQSNQAIHIEMPHQVKFTFDIEKWKQNLCEPIYCYDQQWLRKPYGPSLSDGPSSFRTCGPHCEPNCSKCLMTFHKRRVYDVLDVSTPQLKGLNENQIEPFMGRWRSTWGNHQSPLSRSFPLPSRTQEYHYHHINILRPKALKYLSHNVPSHFDGMFVCEDPKAQNASSLTQEFMTSSMSTKSKTSDDMDSSWICEEYGSEGSLAPTPALQHGEQTTMLLQPSSQVCNNMESTTLSYQTKPTPPNNTRHREDEFDFDLEDIMVMEAIWQSIQDQGTCNKYNSSKLPHMKSNQHLDLDTKFQINVDLQEISKPQHQLVESRNNDQHHHQTNRKAGSLASAIAALAERQATKKEAIFVPHESCNKASLCELEPINKVEYERQPCNIMNVEDDNKFVSKGLVYKSCDKNEVLGESDLHAMTMTLATKSRSKDCLETSSTEVDNSEVFINSCQNDQCFQQDEDGASTSTHSAHSPIGGVCVAPANSPIVRINRCTCDANGQVILPNSFEEQMMLAMALSIIDAN